MAHSLIDITNQRYGKVIVLCREKYNNKMLWKCLCDCGNYIYQTGGNIRSGRIKSCGCSKNDRSERSIHNLSKSRLYSVWCGMLQRCENVKSKSYKDYGGRGIIVCQEWHSSKSFFDWALENGYAENLQLDRINNNGNYEPSNCRFVTREINCRNRRTNNYITALGKRMTISQWATYVGMTRKSLYIAIKRGVNMELYLKHQLERGCRYKYPSNSIVVQG